MKKILLVGSQHGNERLGEQLYEYIATKQPELLTYIDYHCANPLAYKLNKRFIDTDMNRSYIKSDADSYEIEQAKKLSALISSSNYECVIDCHTTTTEVGLCFIIKNTNETTRRVINAAPEITNIIRMKEEIADTSLLGVRPNVIAIEANEIVATRKNTLDLLLQMIQTLVSGEPLTPASRSIFDVERFIEPTDTVSSDELRNFKEYSGHYPVLCGGDTKNRTYRGFWATKQPSIFI